MIYTNLLPDEHLKRLKRRLVTVALEAGFILLAVTLAINAGILLTARTIAANARAALSEEQERIEAQYRGTNAEVDAANRELAALSVLAERYRPVAPLYHALATNAPEGITFSALSIDYLNNKIRISGRADTRERLLAYQKLLEKDPRWMNVRVPLANISQKTNIPFELSFSLKP